MTLSRLGRRGDAGSALMLVPAMVLVLVVLGAIAVDFAVVFLAQRELSNRTAGAANDIAGFAVSDERFYREGRIVLGEDQANEYVALIFAGARVGDRLQEVEANVDVGDRTVTVRAEGRVQYVFARGLPGAAHSTVVRATSTAEAIGG